MDIVLTLEADRKFLRKEARKRIDAKPDQQQKLLIARQNLEEAELWRRKLKERETKQSKKSPASCADRLGG